MQYGRVPGGVAHAEGRPGSGSSATIILGAAFLGNQVYEWLYSTDPLVHQRLRLALLHHVGPPRPPRLHRAGRHGLPPGSHDVATRAVTPASSPLCRASRYYWHFVDIVWVGLYSCLFLLK